MSHRAFKWILVIIWARTFAGSLPPHCTSRGSRSTIDGFSSGHESSIESNSVGKRNNPIHGTTRTGNSTSNGRSIGASGSKRLLAI